jgi:hypothetical protein
MSARWFRFYADAMRKPKVARLSDKDFRLWVELLAIASENDGHIPDAEDLKHLLRRRLDHLKGGIERLLRARLIDCLSDGYKPHSWDKYQYKSDTSTERVKAHREKCNVSVTPPDTDTDTDTEEPKGSTPIPPRKTSNFPCPDWADENVWSDLLRNRKTKRLTNTKTAHDQFVQAVVGMADDEWPPGRILKAIVAKGWGGAYDPRDEGKHSNAKPSNRAHPTAGKRDGFTQAIVDTLNKCDNQQDGGQFLEPERIGFRDSGGPRRIAGTGFD